MSFPDLSHHQQHWDPTTQHHQQPNQEPQHSLEAILIGQAGWQPQRGSQRQHHSLSCTLQPRQAGGRRGCRSPSPRWQLPELSITAMGLGYRRDGIQEGWDTGEMGSCPTKSSPSPKARGLLISILTPAEAVSNEAGPFIQACHCFPDSQCFAIN